MTYKGHVENGVIVLDDPAELHDGMQVWIDLQPSFAELSKTTPLRGTAYKFDDPFTPAVADVDWDASK